MSKSKFGIAVADEIVSELESIHEACADLDASRSEIVEAILTAYFQSDVDHTARVREMIIRRRKGGGQ